MKTVLSALALTCIFAASGHAESNETVKAMLKSKNASSACYECVNKNEGAFEAEILICSASIDKNNPWPGIEKCFDDLWDLAQKLCANVCIPQGKK